MKALRVAKAWLARVVTFLGPVICDEVSIDLHLFRGDFASENRLDRFNKLGGSKRFVDGCRYI